MKKGIKTLAAAALAVSALTPVAAAAASNVADGVYTSTNYYSLPEFKKLSSADKGAALTSTGAVVVINGQAYKGSDILTATDAQLPTLGTAADTYTTAAGNKLVSGQKLDTTTASVGELKVESVSAINAKQIEVKFSEAMRGTDLIDSTTVTGESVLKAGLLQYATGLTNTVTATPANTKYDNIGASLSADKKTLTLTLGNDGSGTEFTWVGTNEIVFLPQSALASDVNNEAGTKQLSSYKTSFIYADTDFVDVKNVEMLSGSKARIHFTEPVNAIQGFQADGTTASTVPVSAKYVDTTVGKAITVSSTALATADATPDGTHKVAVVPPTAVVQFIDVDLADADIVAGKEIEITLPSLRDSVNNVSSPKKVKVTKAIDTTKPTVTSAKIVKVVYDAAGTGITSTVDVTLSKKVVTGTVNHTGISVGGLSATAATVRPDGKTLRLTITGKVNGGNNEIDIPVDVLTDLEGNKNDAYGVVHVLTADTTAPSFTAHRVAYNQSTGVSSLILTANEDVILNPVTTEKSNTKVKFEWLDAYGVTNTFESTLAELATNVAAYDLNNEGKEVAINLTATLTGTLNGTGSVTTTLPTDRTIKFSVTPGFVVDNSDNNSVAYENKTFSIGETPATGTGSILVSTVAQQSTPANTPGAIDVTFTGGALNPTEAVKASYYTVEGATVKEVKLIANSASGATVRLILNEGTVEDTGAYRVTVKRIPTLNSSAAANIETAKTVNLGENILPTVEKVVVGTLDANNIVATFTISEVVTDGAGTNDVALYVNGIDTGVRSTLGTVGTAVNGRSPVSFTWTDGTPGTVSDLTAATSIKLVILDNNDVTDAAGNKLKVGEIVIK